MNAETKAEVPQVLATKPTEEAVRMQLLWFKYRLTFHTMQDVAAPIPQKSEKKKMRMKPTPRKTAYTYWRQSQHGQSHGMI